MVGMGVTENAALKPNVKEGASGFSVTYVRAKTGKGAALHRHATGLQVHQSGRGQACGAQPRKVTRVHHSPRAPGEKSEPTENVHIASVRRR
jgi:hypothetical protein